MLNSGMTGLKSRLIFHEVDREMRFINAEISKNIKFIKERVKNLIQLLEKFLTNIKTEQKHNSKSK